MKSLGRIIGRQSDASGFSLVELMIVVAIIGVLTAIAIPNFQAFQRRSRQSEAKAALTSIYTAEQTFHSSWEVYTGSLVPAGWSPSGDYRYQLGFNSGSDGFCGTSANAIADGNMIMCGPAPGRVYTGQNDDAAQSVTVESVCASNSNCATVFSSDVASKITQGTLTDHDSNPATASIYVVVSMNGEVSAGVMTNIFSAAAVGDILGLEDSMRYDTWSINQEKKLVNEHNGADF